MDFQNIKKVHFIGIGGIGMSALARMFLLEGKQVGGSDREKSLITNELKKLGAKIYLGHKKGNIIEDIDLVIYTIAISADNSELKTAKNLNIPILTYPEALGLISKDKYTIAVSGTHGKTTVTAMIGKVLKDAGLEPTIIVGSLLRDGGSNPFDKLRISFSTPIGTNFITGKSKYFVVEACEYKKSFLNLDPNILVITNIDADHLDYYGSLKNVIKAFSELASKLGKDDYLVCNKADKNLKSVIKKAKCKIIDYAGNADLNHDLNTDFHLKVLGKHNIENAKAALAVAKILEVDEDRAINSLNNFDGTWRRLEYKGKSKKGFLVYDDYAHHPTEIKASLSALREIAGNGLRRKARGKSRRKILGKKIFVIFQPHLYSRTKLLLNEFAKSFNGADYIIVVDIYAAREKNTSGINGKDLYKAIKSKGVESEYCPNWEGIVKKINDLAVVGDMVITMGAGDIYKLIDRF